MYESTSLLLLLLKFRNISLLSSLLKYICWIPKLYSVINIMADFKYRVNTDVNIGVSVSRGGNTLFEVMGIC